MEERPMRLANSLAHLKREISEEKCAEARQWTGGWASRKIYKLPLNTKLDGMIYSQ